MTTKEELFARMKELGGCELIGTEVRLFLAAPRGKVFVHNEYQHMLSASSDSVDEEESPEVFERAYMSALSRLSAGMADCNHQQCNYCTGRTDNPASDCPVCQGEMDEEGRSLVGKK
jgi:hypothetical protein